MYATSAELEYPSFRWDDGLGCAHTVILTKVRTQGNGRCPFWLWVLTFVRMTDGCQDDGRLSG